jgi:hypothetical protein
MGIAVIAGGPLSNAKLCCDLSFWLLRRTTHLDDTTRKLDVSDWSKSNAFGICICASAQSKIGRRDDGSSLWRTFSHELTELKPVESKDFTSTLICSRAKHTYLNLLGYDDLIVSTQRSRIKGVGCFSFYTLRRHRHFRCAILT